jgi:hypothetical protein
MRISLMVVLLFALSLPGCAKKRIADSTALPRPRTGSPTAPTSKSATTQALIITPETALVGKVALVNPSGRFVVLNFPLGKMAAADQRLSLYRRGLKVGEVKVTGPVREDNIVADLVAGEAAVGDEVRSQ